MSKQSAIDAMAQASEREQAKPPVFLNAWMDGVYLAGERFFNVSCESVGVAVSVDQLRPDPESMVFQGIGALST